LATPANSWSTNPKRVLIRSKAEELRIARKSEVSLTADFLLWTSYVGLLTLRRVHQ
jgi:hypothetical protein